MVPNAARNGFPENPGAEGDEIRCMEAMGEGRVGAAILKAWDELEVEACGYCKSRQIATVADLLSENPKPSSEEIDEFLWGKICSCAPYKNILAGVARAAEILES